MPYPGGSQSLWDVVAERPLRGDKPHPLPKTWDTLKRVFAQIRGKGLEVCSITPPEIFKQSLLLRVQCGVALYTTNAMVMQGNNRS